MLLQGPDHFLQCINQCSGLNNFSRAIVCTYCTYATWDEGGKNRTGEVDQLDS